MGQLSQYTTYRLDNRGTISGRTSNYFVITNILIGYGAGKPFPWGKTAEA
jgi:hypothetical protein